MWVENWWYLRIAIRNFEIGYNYQESTEKVKVSVMTNDDKKAIPIKLKWGSSDKAPTYYANNLYITHAGNEFYLVFGELGPILDIDVEDLPEFLDIKPIVKIAVSPDNMIKIAKAIQENMELYSKKKVD